MLVDIFRVNIFPYLVQIGVILFVFGIFRMGYNLYRTGNWNTFLDQFKSKIIAYALITGAFTIVNFIDKVIKGFKV